MSDPRLHDPRIVQALLLLQDALRRPSAGPAAPAAASDDDWLVSSTDILTPWYPEHAAAGSGYIPGAPPAAAWDAYFAGLAPSFVQPNDGLDRLAPVPEPESLPFDAGEPSRAALAVPLEPQAAIAESDQSAAEAVIEALYGFVHAIARADVPAAMRWVASDYHSMEDDREVTFETLQQQLEDLVDARRDRGLDVSLAQVPEPIASPYGVLVDLTIQIESRDDAGVPRTSLLHRVAVFRPDREDRWLLRSLGLVKPLP